MDRQRQKKREEEKRKTKNKFHMQNDIYKILAIEMWFWTVKYSSWFSSQ